MAIMLGKLYAALRPGDVPEDKAREAAEEVAAYDNRLAAIESDLRVMKWAQPATFAMTVAIFVKLFIH